MSNDFDSLEQELEREIERLRRRHAHLLLATQDCREAPCRWELTGRELRWRVFLDDILEPDLDVEILSEVIVVRGALDRDAHPAYHALLPLPRALLVDTSQPRVRFTAGVLEIRIERRP